jgi:hypothetical protein
MSPQDLAKWRSEFVHVTPQYSNAVLAAIMPRIADFAQKLNLPLPKPVAPAMVQHFKCDRTRGQAGGVVTLTNGSEFTLQRGRVCIYRSPRSFYSTTDPAHIADFYGTTKIKEKAALKIARSLLAKLGDTENIFHTETPPKITPPCRVGFHSIPRYLFQWCDPSGQGSQTATPPLLAVEVNAANGQIEMFTTSMSAAPPPSALAPAEEP